MSQQWYCISRKRNGTLNVQPLDEAPAIDLNAPTICKGTGAIHSWVWSQEEQRHVDDYLHYEVYFDRAALLKPFPAPAVEMTNAEEHIPNLTRFPLPCFISATASIAGRLRLTHLSAW